MPTQNATIRPLMPDDMGALMALLEAIDLFPPSELAELRVMLGSHFEGGLGPDHVWLVDDDQGLAAVSYYAPERMTSGTWNIYLLGVHPDRQGEGRGAAMLRHIEAALTDRGERLVLVETLGLPSFEGQRAFYRRCGYEQEATIREFYEAGADKVVFRKRLTASSPDDGAEGRA